MKEKKNGKKLIEIIVALVLVVAIGVLGFVGNFLVTYAIGRAGDGGNREVAIEVDDSAVSRVADEKQMNIDAQRKLTAEFLERVPEQLLHTTSDDGLNLCGGYFENRDSHKWVILVHGYRGNRKTMNSFAQRYYDMGYQVLSPDLRGCGDSEGDFIGMGVPDRLDILKWIDLIVQMDPQAEIVLHGISMGGATVMMTSGENLPDNVICIVEDCGYTSVWDIFTSELRLRFNLPQFPVLYAASFVSDIRAGYDFRSVTSTAQVAKSNIPMLFIHGNQDDFVPFEMLDTVYNAKPGEKQMLVADGAGHGVAKEVLGDVYWNTVFDFIDRYAE